MAEVTERRVLAERIEEILRKHLSAQPQMFDLYEWEVAGIPEAAAEIAALAGGEQTGAPAPIARRIIYFGQPGAVVCDARCDKAWGLHNRPSVWLSTDPDDYAFLADHELGEAPDDPGTYEGGHAKPTDPSERLNKWCIRECERSRISQTGRGDEMIEAPSFSRRLYNQPWKHPGAPAPCDERRNGEDPKGLRAKPASAMTEGQAPHSPDPLRQDSKERGDG